MLRLRHTLEGVCLPPVNSVRRDALSASIAINSRNSKHLAFIPQTAFPSRRFSWLCGLQSRASNKTSQVDGLVLRSFQGA